MIHDRAPPPRRWNAALPRPLRRRLRPRAGQGPGRAARHGRRARHRPRPRGDRVRPFGRRAVSARRRAPSGGGRHADTRAPPVARVRLRSRLAVSPAFWPWRAGGLGGLVLTPGRHRRLDRSAAPARGAVRGDRPALAGAGAKETLAAPAPSRQQRRHVDVAVPGVAPTRAVRPPKRAPAPRRSRHRRSRSRSRSLPRPRPTPEPVVEGQLVELGPGVTLPVRIGGRLRRLPRAPRREAARHGPRST